MNKYTLYTPHIHPSTPTLSNTYYRNVHEHTQNNFIKFYFTLSPNGMEMEEKRREKGFHGCSGKRKEVVLIWVKRVQLNFHFTWDNPF